MKPSYTLEELDTTKTALVVEEVEGIFARVFPGENDAFIGEYFREVAGMFNGEYGDYQAMDTFYHDLEHTMQATLCWVRMMGNRQLLGFEPQLTLQDFKIGMVAILLHDVGYLKKKEDPEGTGAKFTMTHEHRGCEFADLYLESKGWAKKDIFAVQHIILSTGPRAQPETIPYGSEMEEIIAQGVATADYIGQMSDPHYVRKLSLLYKEFEESDCYRGVPFEKRLFKSFEELIRGTPFFWREIVIPKLDKECGELYKFLAEPYPDGPNPYLETVEKHLETVKAMAREYDASRLDSPTVAPRRIDV